MKLHIIAAALPPHLDGIGDYTACLAAELGRSAEVTLLAGVPDADSISGVCIKAAFSAEDPASVRQITRFVAEDRPDWVLLQYNPFMYGRWGLNLHLPEMMRGLRRAAPGTRLAVMVHEPFVPVITPQFAVMSTWQRWQLWRLGQVADIVFFSIEPWAERFRTWFPGKPLVHLPVGSNIPVMRISREEARARLGIPDDALVLGLFGTASAARLLDWVRDAAVSLGQSHSPHLLYVGPDNEKVRAAMGDVALIADGPASPEEVSKRFAAMDIYLVPYSDGISTRRTTLMTALQHGVATVGTQGPLTDTRLKQEAGQAFLLADVADPKAFTAAVVTLAQDAEQRQQLGQAAQQLYEREFSWGKIASQLMTVLKQS